MDCSEVQRLLSDRQGSGAVDDLELDRALGHCEDCQDCASFARALAALDAIPRPAAPDRVVRRTLEAVNGERLAIEAEAATAAADVAFDTPYETEAQAELIPMPSDERPEPAWRSFLAGPRLAIVASAAAVFVVAVGVTVNLMTAPLARDADYAGVDGEVESLQLAPPTAASEAYEDTRSGSDSSAYEAAPSSAPPYVLVDGFVYVVGAEVTGHEVLPTSIGQASTAKHEAGASPRSYAVFTDESGAYYLAGSAPGVLAPLTAVVRIYAGRTYALTTDTAIGAYGDWPSLPIYVPTPANDDGTPFFVEAGVDSRNIPVFARVGGTPEDGFAVAPGTSATDPAAGNPNWTWWTPTEP